MADPRPRAADAAAAAGLIALTLFLFPRAAFKGEVFYERDVHLVWQPQVEAFARSILSGSWPVWNPWLSFGHPLLAKPDTQVFYPSTWLNLVLQPWTSYKVLVFSHFVFAGLGVYLLGRRFALSRPAAFVAAACWISSGPILSLGNIWLQLTGASWIPWVLLGADLAATAAAPASVVFWGFTIAMQVLTGSPEMSVMTALCAGSLIVSRMAGTPHARAGAPRMVAVALGAYAFGLALSAALWIPALELARTSARGHLDAGQRGIWSVHPWGLLEALLPVPVAGLPIQQRLRDLLYDGGQPLVRSLYLGVPSAILVAAGLARGPFGWRRPWLAGLGVAAALVALGRHAFVHELLAALVPPFRSFRYPSKAVVFVALAWALLAGLGFENWRRSDRAPSRGWLAGVLGPVLLAAALAAALGFLAFGMPAALGRYLLPEEAIRSTWADALRPAAVKLACAAALGTAAVAAGLARLRRPRQAGVLMALLAALVIADAVIAGHDVNPTAPAEFYGYRPPILDRVRQDDLSRLYVVRYPAAPASPQPGPAGEAPYLIRRYPAGFSLAAGRTLAARLYVMPPVGGCWGLFGSYEPDLLGLYPRHLADLTGWMAGAEATPAHLRLLRMGAVRYVSALHEPGLDLVPAAAYESLLARPIRLFEVPDPRPRTYVVGTARAADGDAARQVLLDPAFDLAREVVVPHATMQGAAGFSGSSRVVDFRADRVRLEVEASAPGIVVLVDTWDAGWKATVDGRPAPLLRANVAFRGVAVPAGRHVVEQVYRPRSVLAGLAVSAAALAAGLAAALRATFRAQASDR